jgi:hypothetical protein
MAEAKTDKHPDQTQTDEPAKGGIKAAHQKPHTSGDSQKAEGDKLQHAVDDTTRKNN